jgi:hypothetical protein
MLLNHVSAGLVDWMRNVSVQFIGCVIVSSVATVTQSDSAVVAVIASHRILVAATRTAIRQLAARHSNEGTLRSFNNFQIANYKAAIESN